MNKRFQLEKRIGIIALYDTHHAEYKNTPGCHGDYPWVVAYWHGYKNEKDEWCMNKNDEEQATRLQIMLNDFDEMERTVIST